MSVKSKSYRLRIFPATYLHISSGEWLDPTQYVIKNDRLYVINQPRFIADLRGRDPASFDKILNMTHDRIAQYFSDVFYPEARDTWIQCHPIDKSMQEKYDDDLKNPNAQQLVSTFISNRLTGEPYIPGSSIKGAIRTAILAYLINKTNTHLIKAPNGTISDRDLEPKIFEYLDNKGRPSITEDPFKWMKVSDASFGSGDLVLKMVKNVKRSNADEETRRHKLGELNYLCQMLNKGTSNITARIDFNERWLSKYPVSMFIHACQDFFRQKVVAEAKFFKKDKEALYQKILLMVDKMGKNSFFLLLGKGPGSLHKSINDPETTTRNLVGGLPMGICLITLEELS